MDNINQTTHNPDVLSCLANLSNDEVFTPPQLANEVLDLLPNDIWSNPNITFLDPCCKTGVFLRQITIRLIDGLKDEIPDLQERVNHILTKQVFGIAITELTALMTRRTLYCSKNANGKYSICTEFGNNGGNIYYNPKINHRWNNGNCEICGASQELWKREDKLENHAYAFIHKELKEIFHMKFDVIIGNPPYQLSDSKNNFGASPIYHKFVKQAKNLNPQFITMIIPSRWLLTGKGLDEFRKEMLSDKCLKKLVDFYDSEQCFSGVNIGGGVCYFLWQNNHYGHCHITTINSFGIKETVRPLLEEDSEVFIRDSNAVSIINKIKLQKEESFSNFVSSSNPFGFRTFFKGTEKKINTDDVLIYQRGGTGYVKKNLVKKNKDLIDKYKVMTSRVYGDGGKTCPNQVINKAFVADVNTCCTETYLLLGTYNTLSEAHNATTYIETKFFRFLVSLIKITQDSSSKIYKFVPIQDFSKPWTDQELYEKYGLTQDEIDYIESMIRPMGNKEE